MIKHKKFLSYIKMGKVVLTFGNIAIEKSKFQRNKIPVPLSDVDIERALLSKKISIVKKSCKYFNGYLYNDHKVKTLHIILAKTS